MYRDKIEAIFEGKSLHNGIWAGEKMIQKVRDRLAEIADDFIENHEIPTKAITDIIVTGSLASYSYTPQSDIDLHIIVDPDAFDADEDILDDYFKAIKKVWNEQHRILVCGHEVEIYVQKKDDPHYTLGIYSIADNEWVQKPDKKLEQPDQHLVKRKTDDFIEKIVDAEQLFRDGSFTKAVSAADRLMDKLKATRQSGLEKSGVASVENLVFKSLRNLGYLERLGELESTAYDRNLSLEC